MCFRNSINSIYVGYPGSRLPVVAAASVVVVVVVVVVRAVLLYYTITVAIRPAFHANCTHYGYYIYL